ncbi:hypothetical protein ILUMI_25945 [Ignelater luminosus]|uniref:Uncharacterized protein n=1 Tax=Ignelater luminosus TaxID=2038154 RepID=A0A8K0FZF3_IGNLU|nr:hypothetical protein ILUMI_25945 [Ignelater luminosus]
MTDNVQGRNLGIKVQAHQSSTQETLLRSEDCRSLSNETRLRQSQYNIGLYALALLVCAGSPYKHFPVEFEQELPEEQGLPQREEERPPVEQPQQSLSDYLCMVFVGTFVALPIGLAAWTFLLFVKNTVSEVQHVLNNFFDNNTISSLL